MKQKKDYSTITDSYLKSNNLQRVMLKNPATGVPSLAQVTKEQAKRLERQGKLANPTA